MSNSGHRNNSKKKEKKMKILVLASGGDAPGMNKFIAKLAQHFGKSLYACKRGFRGLCENDTYPIRYFEPQKHANEAGCCITSARFPEFKEKQNFEKAVKNAKAFDAVVVLGGNGSQKAVLDMEKAGVKAVFVPCTIDNDVEESEYSIGFDTAVESVKYAFKNVMPSMQAFTRSCVFVTMGRHCGKIAEAAAKAVDADLLITQKAEINEDAIVETIKKNHLKDRATSIILRENVVDTDKFCKKIGEKIAPIEIRPFVVGYLQRGSKPTARELRIAYQFALAAIRAIEIKKLPIATLMEGGKIILKRI